MRTKVTRWRIQRGLALYILNLDTWEMFRRADRKYRLYLQKVARDALLSDLTIRYERMGKRLRRYDEQRGDTDILYSVSHSGALVVIAVGSVRHLGVDVERLIRRFGWKRLGERMSSVGEKVPQRPLEVIGRWTQKEAFGKAICRGMAYDLRGVALVGGRVLYDGRRLWKWQYRTCLIDRYVMTICWR